ncbi:MAG: ABC transporter ATP-binding protein [Proteobacteria bacterium]|nr:ABC transporter ATP-binding protein [Pseudomonadota bacterium]MBU1742270.1 ABC transporter ATP-binding protein [Pseudomonadota bacterium]
MALFEAINLGISFGGLVALQRVGFQVSPGEVFSIIGPNGAGKTTIFNCLSRFYNLDEGRLIFKGRDITRNPPHTVAGLGIARTFQNIELFKNMTVVDNILLGCHCRRRSNLLTELFFLPSVARQEVENRRQAEEIIHLLELQAFRDQVISSLPYGAQKTVELGRALAMKPELLLLDEPSSGLDTTETMDLALWIKRIKDEFGVTIILVEHNMGLVREVSDRLLALNFGEIITQGDLTEVLSHPETIRAYLGEEDAFAQAL